MRYSAAHWFVLAASMVVFVVSGCGERPHTSPAGEPVSEVAPKETELPPPDEKRGHEPADVVWNTYHGGFSLRGVADTALPETLEPAWRFMAGAPVFTTPVAGDGRIYFANTKGRLFAVDAQGDEIWSRTLPREARHEWSPTEQEFDAPLTFYDGVLLAGSADGIVFALDAASGEVLWETDIDGAIMGIVNVVPAGAGNDAEAGARVYVIEQSYGILHCLDFQTGEMLWQSEPVDRCDGSPGVGDGVAVFGSCAAALHIFSSNTGDRLHDVALGGDSEVAGGVAVVDGAAYAGSRSGKLVKADVRDGTIVWANTDCDDEAFSTPAVSDEWVVFGCAGGTVHALDRDTGQTRWTFGARGTVASPVIAGDKVVASANGVLFLLALDDGRELWSYDVSDEITAPAVVGRMVLTGSSDGTVAAFR